MSQALDYIDKFRKNQESKEDKSTGPDAAEIDDLASNLQEVSQGANAPNNKVNPYTALTYTNFKLNTLSI